TVETRGVGRGRYHNREIAPWNEAVSVDHREQPLCGFGGGDALAPLVLKPREKPQGDGQRLRLSDLLGQTQRVLCMLDGTVGTAEQPASGGELIAATRAGIVAGIQERLRRVSLGLIEGDGALHVRDGSPRVAHGEQRRPERMVGLHEAAAVVAAAGVLEQTLTFLTRRRVRPQV